MTKSTKAAKKDQPKESTSYQVVEQEFDGEHGWWVTGEGLDEPLGPYAAKKEAEKARTGQVNFDQNYGEMMAATAKKKRPTTVKPPVESAEKVAAKAERGSRAAKKKAADKSPKPVKKAAKVDKEKPVTKATKVKKASTTKKPKVFDTYSVGPFVRWLGIVQGFDCEGATELLKGEKCLTIKEVSVKWELKETRRDPASVTASHEKQLRSKYKKLFATAKKAAA